MYRDLSHKVAEIANEAFDSNIEIFYQNQQKLDSLFQILLQNKEPNNVALILESDEFQHFSLPARIISAFIFTATTRREIDEKQLENSPLVLEYYAEILEHLIQPLKNPAFSVSITLDVLIVYLRTIHGYIKQTLEREMGFIAKENEPLATKLTAQLDYFALYTNFLGDEFQYQTYKRKGVESNYISYDEHFEISREKAWSGYNTIGQLSSFNTPDDVYNELMIQIRAFYRSMEAIDGEGGTMLDCFGRLQYHGSQHYYYDLAMVTLNADIYDKVVHLPMPDLARLFYDLSEFTEEWLDDVEDWKDFRKRLMQSDEMSDLVKELKHDFLNSVPNYDPDEDDE